jgi:hypothetical protein
LASPRRRKAKASVGSISKARSKSSSRRGLEKNDIRMVDILYIYRMLVDLDISIYLYIVI